MAAARMLLLLALALAIASSAAFFQGTPLVGGAGRAAAASSLRSLSMVKVGEMAPDFIAKDQSGKDFKLSTLKGKKSVVL
jgi:cytochrome oxidase Cu insertion factor (SCO1/SenC/PrrC family)